jgi:hypothetical protein
MAPEIAAGSPVENGRPIAFPNPYCSFEAEDILDRVVLKLSAHND